MGPTCPSHAKGPAPQGKWPVPGIRPGVGFSPQMPVKCAGTRIDPPPSLPTPPTDMPAATAADSPPLDPPAVRSRSQGFFVRPYIRLSVSYAIRNSGVLVTPSTIAPADFNRRTSTASFLGTFGDRSLLPASHLIPATSMHDLIETGTPCIAPG